MIVLFCSRNLSICNLKQLQYRRSMYRTRNTAKIHWRCLRSRQSLHHKSWRRTFSNRTIECNFLLLSSPFVSQITIFPSNCIWFWTLFFRQSFSVEKIFHEINSLVKKSFSRNFCKNSEISPL